MKHIIFIRDGLVTKGLDAVKDGIYILTEEKSKATAGMFGYLFGYVYKAILEEMGQEQSVEAFKELDRMLKERFGAAEMITTFELRRKQIVNAEKFEITEGKPFVKISEKMQPKSKADYTVQEMQDYWMALQKLVAEMWGRTLKDPDPNWKDGWKEETK